MNIQKLTVPYGWQIDRVGNCCLICNHLREPISATIRQTMQGDYPYYGPTQAVDFLDHYRLNGKYALIGEDGDHFLKYANRSMTQLVKGKFNVNNHAHVIQGTEKCSAEWFFFFFQHTNIFPFLTRQGAGRYKLNKATLQKLPILLPPLPEQRKIADILGAWDEEIRLTERLIEAKQTYKKGLMQQLLTGKMRFPGFEGEEWQTVKLIDICTRMASGGTPSTQNEPFWTGSIPWVTGADFGELKIANVRRYITEEAVKSSSTKLAARGDILLVTRTGVGKIAIASFDIAISQDVTVLITNNSVDNQFLLYYLFSTIPLLARYNQGTSINGITRKDLKKHRVLLPSIQEQQKIAALLQGCDDEITLLQRKSAALREQKKGLMQQLLTGKMRVV